MSCTKDADPISLVCTGTATISGNDGKKQVKPETLAVKRTYRFSQEQRDVQFGNVMQDGSSASKVTRKLVWVFNTEDYPEIFESRTETIDSDGTKIRADFRTTSVSDTELSASDQSRGQTNGATYSDDFNIKINRISGDFIERRTTKAGSDLYITTVTEGQCKKATKKF